MRNSFLCSNISAPLCTIHKDNHENIVCMWFFYLLLLMRDIFSLTVENTLVFLETLFYFCVNPATDCFIPIRNYRRRHA